MGNLRCILRDDLTKKRRYFREARGEITEKNLQLLKTLSLITAVMLLFFYLLTPLIIRGWTITPQHLLFLPAALTVYLIAVFYQKRGRLSSRVVTGLCLLFGAVLFVFIILIDVLPNPNTPSSFMPVLCIALPVLFILPFHQIYTLTLLFESVYIILVSLLKTPQMGQYDIFDSVVGVVFSIAVAQTIIRLRIQDHEIRLKYKQLSTQDTLSGILNKKACEEEAEHYLRSRDPSASCMMIILDIDDFKRVNDSLGHYTGDVLLRRIGDMLRETFRATDIIGRFGGDEFMVLIKESSDKDALEEKCRAIQERLLRFSPEDSPIQVKCSIGGVLVKRQEADFASLFKQADDAMYEAKRRGKNRYVLRGYHSL